MRFTHYNNPSRKHRAKRQDLTERMIVACKERLDDKERGRERDESYYTDKYQLDGRR